MVAEHNGIPGVHSLGAKLAIRADDYDFSGPFDGPDGPLAREVLQPHLAQGGSRLASGRVAEDPASWGESFVPPLTRNLFSSTNGPFNFLRVVDPENPGPGCSSRIPISPETRT